MARLRSQPINRRNVLVFGGTAAMTVGVAGLTPALAKAPKLGVNMPKSWRYELGEFEVTTIMDSEAFIDGPYPLIGKNAGEANVRALMRANFVPETRYQPGFSPTVVNTGKELVLFDTGNGSQGFVPRPDGGWLFEQLGPAGIRREDIDVVVLSHGHPDHIGGLMEGGKPLCPNARYVISATEYDFWSPEGKHTGPLENFSKVFRSNALPVAEKFTMIKPGDDVVPGIRSIAAAGHTPGHLAFVIESAGKQMLLWGDCAHHHVASLARPEWLCVFDTDQEAAAETRKKIFDMAATERWPIIGYHMPFPSIGYVERRQDHGYRWIAHSFQLYP